MAFAIKYCEKCGERVEPSDFESGKAITYRNESYCGKCKVEILPRIEKDPEYQRSLQQSSRSSGAHSIGSRPSSVRIRPAGSPSSVYRRPSSGLHPIPAGSPRPSSSRSPRPRSDSKTTLVLGLSIVTGLVLIGVIGAVAASMRGSDDPPPPVDPPENPDDGTGVPSADRIRWESTYSAAQAFEKRVLAEVDDPDPRKRRDPIEAERAVYDNWRQVLTELGGSPFHGLAEDRRKEAERKLQDRAQRYFEHTQRTSDAALKTNNFDLARAAWKERFPEALLFTPEWKARVQTQIDAVEKAYAEWKAKPPPDPVRPDVHGTGRPIPDASWRGLQVPVGADPRLQADGDAYLIDCTAGDGIRITISPSFAVGSLRMEIRLDSGAARIEGPGGHMLDLSGSAFATGSWLEFTVQYESEAVRAWIGDSAYPLPRPRRAPGAGPLVLLVPKGQALRVRNMTILFVEGTPNPEEAPSAKGEVVLFDGKDLARFRQMGGTFRVEDGAILCANADGTQTVMVAGDENWGEGRLTFQVRGLEGAESLYFLFNLTEKSENETQGDPGELKGTYFTDPGAWTEVEILASGDSIVVKIGGQSVSRAGRQLRRGPLAIMVPQGTTCQLRNIRIVLQ